MKLIKPSYEILNTNEVSLAKSIELAARTCYKSEDKISKDESSALDLCNKLVKRKHDAMLEFGNDIIVEIPNDIRHSIRTNMLTDSHLELSSSVNVKTTNSTTDIIEYYKHYGYIKTNDSKRSILSGSARAIIAAFSSKGSTPVLAAIVKLYPDLLPFISEERLTDFKEYNNIILPFIKLNENNLTDAEKLIHTTKTVRFISNRGFSHELVRHRPASFAQESTRYVNYKGGCQFIIPHWFNESDVCKFKGRFDYGAYVNTVGHMTKGVTSDWLSHIDDAEIYYQNVIKQGMSPQDARDGLPIAVKTEIIMKTRLRHWVHVFKQRVPKSAHPQMRELMIPLLEDFKKINPYFKTIL